MKRIILLLTFATLFGCTTTKQVMDSWVGATKQRLVMNWGAPTRSADDGNGGEILVYAKQVYIQAPSNSYYNSSGQMVTSQAQPINYWEYKMFYVNGSGVIYHWLVQREQIPPMQIDLNVYRRY